MSIILCFCKWSLFLFFSSSYHYRLHLLSGHIWSLSLIFSSSYPPSGGQPHKTPTMHPSSSDPSGPTLTRLPKCKGKQTENGEVQERGNMQKIYLETKIEYYLKIVGKNIISFVFNYHLVWQQKENTKCPTDTVLLTGAQIQLHLCNNYCNVVKASRLVLVMKLVYFTISECKYWWKMYCIVLDGKGTTRDTELHFI